MKNAFITWIAFTCLLLCGGPSSAATADTGDTPPPETKASAGNQDQGEGDQPPEEPEYTYNPEGKTDPFDAFVVQKSRNLSQVKESDVSGEELQKMLAILQDLKRPKTELQTIPLAAIELTAILKTEDQTVAMVKGPKGAKGYMLKEGTYIGKEGGVVEEIVNEEKMTDLGKQLIRKVVIKEPYLDEKRKISYRHVELKMPGSFE